MSRRRSPTPVGTVTAVPEIPLVRLLSMAVTVALEELHRELNAHGHPTLRPVHGYALNAVLNGRSTASAMAPLLGMTKQGAARVVQHLLDEGYVELDDGSAGADARSKPLALTARGREAVALSVEVQQRIETEWAGLVGERRMATTRRALEEAVHHGRDDLPAVRLGW